MKRRVRYKSLGQLSLADTEILPLLPRHYFWSPLEELIDFSFADKLCAFLYKGIGQHPYAPSLKLKAHLVKAYYNLSDRGLEYTIMGDMFVKRFLGVPITFFGMDHSTIALDRKRMGTATFRACHLYILAQMYHHGLWGDKDEAWIIDSFPVQPGIALVGAHRLIQKAARKLLWHTKRGFPALYSRAEDLLLLDAFTARLSPKAETKEQLLAFSRLVAEAYALLGWFETAEVVEALNQGKPGLKEKSLELQALLRRILAENSRLVEPDEDPTDPSGSKTAPEAVEAAESFAPAAADASAETLPETGGVVSESSAPAVPDASALQRGETIQYEKIPLKKRSSDRIISVDAPEARLGKKSQTQKIKGFKVQNVCTCSEVILDVQVIPANEHDREAAYGMVRSVGHFFGVSPQYLVGDTHYGHGAKRELFQKTGVTVVAPVAKSTNAKGKYDISQFEYIPEKDAYRCPGGNLSQGKSHSKDLNGTQYRFGEQCAQCSLRENCTDSQQGRRVFRSDYHEVYQQAQAMNESAEGQFLLQKRYVVERKNAELKNDCGLGRPNVRRMESLEICAILAAMVVNCKLTVRRLRGPQPGFVRRPRKTA